ncbi:hypothetical protein [Branchiibius cervicis]|uniref:Uncharacterized protein n=1 Tax=Branchiibius cervicis TaxID=908252 RepID=A0ABW2APD0_9MICO
MTEDDTREQIARLRLPGQVKLHWRNESDRRRREIIRAVASYNLAHLVVVRPLEHPERSERQRRKCLQRLVDELERLNVFDIRLESRGRADDRRDVEMLNVLKTSQAAARTRLSHFVGRTEPMLWIPDAVCGAVVSARTGSREYQDVLRDRLAVINI